MTLNFQQANATHFSGFADVYDAHRPAPPPVLVALLTQLAGGARPHLVVDVGCGTGLSTRLWAAHADAVIGLEPNADMRAEAARQTQAATIRYQAGMSAATGLPDACADILTVSQALHWMEPAPTFAEFGRVLRTGGVFAAYDHDRFPTMHPDVDTAYQAALDTATALNAAHGYEPAVRRFPKSEHLANIEASGQFRYVKEITLHNVEPASAARVVGMALSQGRVQAALHGGESEDAVGITHLREVAAQVIGAGEMPWYFSYRVRLGIK